MYRKILLIILFSLKIGTLHASATEEISADCKNWGKSADSMSPSKTGYVKSSTGHTYFDFSKKIWIILGDKPMVFLLKDSEVLIFTPQTVEVISYTSKHPETIVELMLALSEFGAKMFKESRWVFRMKSSETFLAGLFANNKSCSAAPKTRAIMCRKGRACSLVPRNKDASRLVSACAKEMGLLHPISVGRLSRTCEIIGDGNTYENILLAYAKAKAACVLEVPDLTPLQRMKQACEDGRSLLNSVK